MALGMQERLALRAAEIMRADAGKVHRNPGAAAGFCAFGVAE